MDTNAAMATIKDRISDNLELLGTLGYTVRFDLQGAGSLFLDGTTNPATVLDTDKAADCTLTLSPESMVKLLNGKLDPMLAFTLGKLKVKGRIGVAMKLAELLEEAAELVDED